MSVSTGSPQSCRECIFWRKLRPDEGECRRHAPTAGTVSERAAHWPHTQGRQWCGEGIAGPAGSATPCKSCRFWRGTAAGLNPTDRGDLPMAWWRKAGLCARFAPNPVSEPGPRTFWAASLDEDYCGDAEP